MYTHTAANSNRRHSARHPAASPGWLQMFLPEVRRHKRGFMKLATNQTFMRMRDAAAAQRLFIQYLRDQLAAAG